MNFLSAVAEIVRDLLIFTGAMTILLVVLLIVVSKLPNDNPLKRLLTALTYRVGATAAAGLVAVPLEPIPGVDVLYDVAAPIALLWYWFTFFREAVRATARPPQPSRPLAEDRNHGEYT
jgi:hypothetical protein